MAMAFFANAVQDRISVNLNNSLLPTVLDQRQTLSVAGTQPLTMTATSFNIKPNRDKGVFGTGGPNQVTIQFESLRPDSSQFDITVTNLTGQNLYFYVFENTMVGQNELGSSVGIKIEMLQPLLKPIQGAGVE
jgi:hypothetical protein